LAASKLEVIGFYENAAGGSFVSSAPTLMARIDLIDTVVPFWSSVDSLGNVTGVLPDKSIIDFVHARRKQVILLVNNLKTPTASNVAMIETAQARTKTVSNLVDHVRKNGYDGVHISFVLMPPSAKILFSAFVRELGLSLHAHGKALGVSIFPMIELPSSVWGAYDYTVIGKEADYVVLQAFDRHWQNTAPGPIAPQSWAEESLKRALREIPAGKLVLGIGAYGYDWAQNASQGRTEYIPAKDAVLRATEVGARVVIDARWQETTFTYTRAGVPRVVWFQDATNARLKTNLARKYGIRGIAVWRLGFEDALTWGEIAKAAGR
jgi:spore germination protein YaaH